LNKNIIIEKLIENAINLYTEITQKVMQWIFNKFGE